MIPKSVRVSVSCLKSIKYTWSNIVPQKESEMRERKIIHPGKLWCSAQDRETAATSKVGLMFYSMWMTKKKIPSPISCSPRKLLILM